MMQFLILIIQITLVFAMDVSPYTLHADGSLEVHLREDQIAQSAHHYIPSPALRDVWKLLRYANRPRFVSLLNKYVPGNRGNILPSAQQFALLSGNQFFGPDSRTRLLDPSVNLDRNVAAYKVDQFPRSVQRKYPKHIIIMNELWRATENALTLYFGCYVERKWTNASRFPEIIELFDALEAALRSTQEHLGRVTMGREDSFPFQKEDWEPTYKGKLCWTLKTVEPVAISSATSDIPPIYISSRQPRPSIDTYTKLPIMREIGLPAGYYLAGSEITNEVALNLKREILKSLFENFQMIKHGRVGPWTKVHYRSAHSTENYIQKTFKSLIENTPRDQCDGSLLKKVIFSVPKQERVPEHHDTRDSSESDDEDNFVERPSIATPVTSTPEPEVEDFWYEQQEYENTKYDMILLQTHMDSLDQKYQKCITKFENCASELSKIQGDITKIQASSSVANAALIKFIMRNKEVIDNSMGTIMKHIEIVLFTSYGMDFFNDWLMKVHEEPTSSRLDNEKYRMYEVAARRDFAASFAAKAEMDGARAQILRDLESLLTRVTEATAGLPPKAMPETPAAEEIQKRRFFHTNGLPQQLATIEAIQAIILLFSDFLQAVTDAEEMKETISIKWAENSPVNQYHFNNIAASILTQRRRENLIIRNPNFNKVYPIFKLGSPKDRNGVKWDYIYHFLPGNVRGDASDAQIKKIIGDATRYWPELTFNYDDDPYEVAALFAAKAKLFRLKYSISTRGVNEIAEMAKTVETVNEFQSRLNSGDNPLIPNFKTVKKILLNPEDNQYYDIVIHFKYKYLIRPPRSMRLSNKASIEAAVEWPDEAKETWFYKNLYFHCPDSLGTAVEAFDIGPIITLFRDKIFVPDRLLLEVASMFMRRIHEFCENKNQLSVKIFKATTPKGKEVTWKMREKSLEKSLASVATKYADDTFTRNQFEEQMKMADARRNLAVGPQGILHYKMPFMLTKDEGDVLDKEKDKFFPGIFKEKKSKDKSEDVRVSPPVSAPKNAEVSSPPEPASEYTMVSSTERALTPGTNHGTKQRKQGTSKKGPNKKKGRKKKKK